MRGAMAGLALAVLMLAGCDGEEPAVKPVTLDARLQAIYSQNCAACHANAESGAPPAHDLAAWKPRLAQGDDMLLTHMVEGFNGMPPLGQCMECGADDLKTLMRFMAAPAPEEKQKADTPQNGETK
jgi:cytochrome c5